MSKQFSLSQQVISLNDVALDNLSRFLARLILKVNNVVGEDFPVMVKLVCDEFVSGGLNIADTKKVALLLENNDIDDKVDNTCLQYYISFVL